MRHPANIVCFPPVTTKIISLVIALSCTFSSLKYVNFELPSFFSPCQEVRQYNHSIHLPEKLSF